MLLLAVALAACGRSRVTSPAPTPPPPVPTGFDDVVVAIDTFDRGIALLRAATGVEPREVELASGDVAHGSPEQGLGTQSMLLRRGNGPFRSALLDLGAGRYLELIGLDPQHPSAARVRETYAMFRALTPIAWAVRTPNADTLAGVLRAARIRPGALRPGERQLAGGRRLRWRTLTPWEMVSTMYPAFIEWAPSSAHPSSAAPAGCSLVSFTLASPDAATMRSRLERAGVRATVDSAARDDFVLTLDCPAGRVRLPAGAAY